MKKFVVLLIIIGLAYTPLICQEELIDPYESQKPEPSKVMYKQEDPCKNKYLLHYRNKDSLSSSEQIIYANLELACQCSKQTAATEKVSSTLWGIWTTNLIIGVVCGIIIALTSKSR